MQTNVRQWRRNHSESNKKDIRCIFADMFRAEPMSDALRTALLNPYYVFPSPDFCLQILMVLEFFQCFRFVQWFRWCKDTSLYYFSPSPQGARNNRTKKQTNFLTKLHAYCLHRSRNITSRSVICRWANSTLRGVRPSPLSRIHKPNLGYVQMASWELSEHGGSDSIEGNSTKNVICISAFLHSIGRVLHVLYP